MSIENSLSQEGHISGKKENDEEDKAEINKRYRYHIAKKRTGKYPELLSDKEKDNAKLFVSEYLSQLYIEQEQREKDLKNPKERKSENGGRIQTLAYILNRLIGKERPDFLKDIKQAKEAIIKFGKERNMDLESRLSDNEKIFLLPEYVYNELDSKENGGCHCRTNEILLKDFYHYNKNNKLNKENLQHELIHSACMQNVFLAKSAVRDLSYDFGNNGYTNYKGPDSKLWIFNEGLTEVTNKQISLDNNEKVSNVSYFNSVIFLTELAKDIANRTKRTQEEILTHFQIGMFESKNKYLKIITDIYGKEAFDALMDMKLDKKDVIRVADIFGLSQVKNKLERKIRKIGINIGKYVIYESNPN